MTVNLVRTKEEITGTVISYIKFIEGQTGNKMKMIQSDNRTFINSTFENNSSSERIIQESTLLSYIQETRRKRGPNLKGVLMILIKNRLYFNCDEAFS